MIHYKSNNEIAKATEKIYRHIDRDYNIRNKIGTGENTNEMPKDLRDAVFYQESFRGCNWNGCDLTNVSGNGTIFSDNDFIQSIINNVSLQYCSFSSDIFVECSMQGSNFANSTFSNCAITNGNIHGCSFVGTKFNCGILRNTPIEVSTFERCLFKDMHLEELDLRQLTLNYATFDNVTMKKVCLPFIQIPYTFNGLQYLYNTTDDITVASHENKGDKISISEYMALLPDFITFFDAQEQFFPLTNCYIVNNQLELAKLSNELGIRSSAARHDFRALYFYCIQASKVLMLPVSKRNEIYSEINSAMKGQLLTNSEYHQFCIYYPMIKKLLFDTPNEKPVLIITLKTNIKPDEYEHLSVLIAALEAVTARFEKDLDSKHIEIRHNSPDVIDFFLSGNLDLLLQSAKEIFDILTPIINDVSDYLTVGGVLSLIGKEGYRRLKNHKDNTKKQPQKEISNSVEITNIRDEVKKLQNYKTGKVYAQIQPPKANSSISTEELMNLQMKLKNKGICIHDINIQCLDSEQDILNALYENSKDIII